AASDVYKRQEERIATCAGLLGRLESALQDYERAARRSGALTEADVQKMRARHEQLKQALAANRFDEVERAARTEIDFVQREREQRQADAIRKETLRRRVQKRTRENEAQLRTSAKSPIGGDRATEQQLELAKKLKEAEDDRSFERWLAAHPSVADTETTRIEQQLAELSFLLDADALQDLERRLQAVEQEPAAQQRNLRLDSLTLELASLVKQARDREATRLRVRALAEELRAVGSAGAVERAATVLAAIDGDLQALSALEADTMNALAAERESLAARARRNAVLKGLATLGYQVHEGLETAWVNSGRVVVKRSTQPGYGVELGGKSETGRLQVRVVALRGAGDAADSTRDKDAERIWCSDFSKLQKQIADEGGGLVIERALGVGETPLKVVEDAETSAAAARAAPRERALPRP
uniref:hypothetical protein n=1 Tax=Steroidobacter cummioxidans TaxID=1803913 RepID=UPI000E314EDB